LKGYWEQLRPLEKRLVVGVGAVLFVVLNAWFVVPHFSDWGKTKARMYNAQRDLKKFQDEITHVEGFEAKKVKTLETEGLAVPQEDQAATLQSTIRDHERQSGIVIGSWGTINTRTNDPFFVEKLINLQAQSKEQQLVDFLYNLGSGNSLIRVRSLGLKPDPSHQLLQASITLVASYQKKPAPKAVAPAAQPAKAPTPTPKTATTLRTTSAPASPAAKTGTPPNSQSMPPVKPSGSPPTSTPKKP
jgi:hypothetical protein